MCYCWWYNMAATNPSSSDDKNLTPGGIVGLVAGVSTGILWYRHYLNAAKRLENQSQFSVSSSPIYHYDINLGQNEHLMVGVDMLNDNTYKNQTLGIGVSYNF